MFFTHSMSLPLLCKEKRFTCKITLPQDLGYENQIVVQVNGINVLNTQKKNELILPYISILSIVKCIFVAKQRKLEQFFFPLKRPVSNIINVK